MAALSADIKAYQLAQETASTLRALAPDASRRNPLLYERLLELADDIQEEYRDVGSDEQEVIG
jgi:recombinational DNA repair protein (RecF pathway)